MSGVQAQPRRLQVAQLGQVAAHFRLVEVGEQVGDRLVAGVVGGAGELAVLLAARALGVAAQFVASARRRSRMRWRSSCTCWDVNAMCDLL